MTEDQLFALGVALLDEPPADAPMPIQLAYKRDDLAAYFASIGFTRGAEVGVWEGAFAATLCAANPALELICVDPWRCIDDYKENKNDAKRMELAYDRARAALAPYNCRFLRMTSAEAAPQIPDGSLDFVYLDGNHLYEHVKHDIETWLPKVRKRGIIAGHDYTAKESKGHFIQVKRAVDEYTRAHAITPWFILADKSASWLWEVK